MHSLVLARAFLCRIPYKSVRLCVSRVTSLKRGFDAAFFFICCLILSHVCPCDRTCAFVHDMLCVNLPIWLKRYLSCAVIIHAHACRTCSVSIYQSGSNGVSLVQMHPPVCFQRTLFRLLAMQLSFQCSLYSIPHLLVLSTISSFESASLRPCDDFFTDPHLFIMCRIVLLSILLCGSRACSAAKLWRSCPSSSSLPADCIVESLC